ncbi:MAG: NUDIX hydrolase [Bacteroidales bacterium]|jgi:ADP-ribose pyrophosphatase YjhB (NUDIX family)|nr:NUDIX hydrolase [Bacteroidales bacterium]
MIRENILHLGRRVNALAEIGLTYSSDPYDVERYGELRSIGRQIMGLLAGKEPGEMEPLFLNEKEYKTPQVDIRAVVFDDERRLLLVREAADGKWSLPGGWADVGLTPSEVAAKEVREETGMEVEPQRLIAVFDKKCHPHPPHLHYAYKIFIGCGLLGGKPQPAFDTLEVGFFPENGMPELSEERVTPQQVSLMFEFLRNPDKQAMFD